MIQLANLSTVTKWLKKFLLCYKDCDDQVHSGRTKSEDSEAMLQVIDTNLMSSALRVSGHFSISQFSMVCQPHNCCKTIQSSQIMAYVSKVLQYLIHPSI